MTFDCSLAKRFVLHTLEKKLFYWPVIYADSNGNFGGCASSLLAESSVKVCVIVCVVVH